MNTSWISANLTDLSLLRTGHRDIFSKYVIIILKVQMITGFAPFCYDILIKYLITMS